MTTTEFECYVRKGLGRAVTLLQNESDKTPFYETIMRIIERQPGYTHISAQYLYELIRASGSHELEDAAVERAGELYMTPVGYSMNGYKLLFTFYGDGNQTAGEKLKDIYQDLFSELSVRTELPDRKNDKASIFMFLSSFIALITDKEWLRRIFRDMGALFERQNMFHEASFYDFFINTRYKLKKSFDNTLTAMSEESPQVKRFADRMYEIDAERLRQIANPSPHRVDTDKLVEEVCTYIISGDGSRPAKFYENFNLFSSEQQRRIARLAEGIHDPARLNRVVSLFTSNVAVWPLDPAPLITLAWEYMGYLGSSKLDTDEKRLAKNSIYALGNFRTDEVRSLAFALIERGYLTEGSALWAKNYKAGDREQFVEMFKKMCLEDWRKVPYYATLDLLKQDFDGIPIELFETIYEYGGNCFVREVALEGMHSRGLLTDAIIEECRHDNDYEVREYIDYLTKGSQH